MIRIREVWKLAFLSLVLSTACAGRMAIAESNISADNRLSGRLDYWFVGHLQQKDSSGRLLVWEATIEGDFHGEMKWWFVIPPPVSPISFRGGRSTFYAARWELWVDDELVLAGETAGKTFYPDGADGIWDGHGRVTEAKGRFKALVGRKVYETGPVFLGEDPPRTYSGTGLFLVF
jgi:hypothetical protein